MVSGVDEHLTNGVGGVDGLYKLDGCFLGCPKYKRAGKAANGVSMLALKLSLLLLHVLLTRCVGHGLKTASCVADVRTLWKSAIFKDWNISAGEDVDLV